MPTERGPFHRFELTRKTARWLAVAFTLFLLLFETLVVGVSQGDEAAGSLDNNGGISSLLATLFLGASFYLVYQLSFAAISSGWVYRCVYLLIFAGACTVEYGYQKALGRFSQVIDLELAVSTTYEQRIESIAMYFALAAIAPVLVLSLLLISAKGWNEHGFRHLLVVHALFIAVLFAGWTTSATAFPTLSPVAFYRTSLDFVLQGPIARGEWGSEITGVGPQRHAVASPQLPAGHFPDNNVVLVIGESMRGDHFSLNGYGRPTTPLLEDLNKRGVLHNWGIAAAASTGSHTSYNTIVTGLTPDDFPDIGHAKLNSTPTIFQYAKAMGYTTWFLDGQMDYFWSGIKDDRQYIDRWAGVNEIKDPHAPSAWDTDIEIARRVSKIVSGSKGNFVVVFTRGSHVPYHRNFPSTEAVWQPSYTSEKELDIPAPDQLDAVANAYDNAIRHHVSSFFENLIENYDQIPNNTVIIYTGDHGQTLFVNGKASHSGHTREEAMVPLFIIGSLEGKLVDTSYKASHQNLYPTILDLLKYPAEMRDRRLPPSLLDAKTSDSRPRFFNPAYGPKIPFD